MHLVHHRFWLYAQHGLPVRVISQISQERNSRSKNLDEFCLVPQVNLSLYPMRNSIDVMRVLIHLHWLIWVERMGLLEVLNRRRNLLIQVAWRWNYDDSSLTKCDQTRRLRGKGYVVIFVRIRGLKEAGGMNYFVDGCVIDRVWLELLECTALSVY